MANIVLIKNGEDRPSFGVLYDNELGYDSKNEVLYVGQSGFPIAIGGKKTEQELDLTGNNINNVAIPQDSLQAANKQYVDSSSEQILEEIKELKEKFDINLEQLAQILNSHQKKFVFDSNSPTSISLLDRGCQVSLGKTVLQTINNDGTMFNNLVLGDYILSKNGNFLTLI